MISMQNQPIQVKSVLLLEDDSFWAGSISKGIRVFGGLPVSHFTSVEKFKQSQNIIDETSLKKELLKFSAIVCDNDFEADDGTIAADQKVKGINFLLKELGPSLSELPQEERPLLICYSPSSESVIEQHESNLWDSFRITSFNKVFETSAIGLAIRFAREWGVPFNRESIVKKILGFSAETDIGGEKETFFKDLLKIARHSLQGEAPTIAEGEVKPMELEQLYALISEKRGMPIEELKERLDRETKSFLPMDYEGVAKKSKED